MTAVESMVGMIVASRRSHTGRRWVVDRYWPAREEYLLVPIGPDVQPAQTGNVFNGGVRSIVVSSQRLRDERFWGQA